MERHAPSANLEIELETEGQEIPDGKETRQAEENHLRLCLTCALRVENGANYCGHPSALVNFPDVVKCGGRPMRANCYIARTILRGGCGSDAKFWRQIKSDEE